MSAIPATHRWQPAPRQAVAALHLLGWHVELRVLQPCFLMRTLLLRFCCILLYSIGLDSLWLRAVSGSHAGPLALWGWPARAAILGLLMPLALHAIGFLWPLVHLQTFEQQYARFHKIIVYGSIAGKVLEEVSTMSVSHGTCQQTLLLHGLLFNMHQDPGYVTPLSVMLVAYSSCHAWTSLISTRAADQGGNLEAAVASGAPAVAIAQAGCFFLTSYLGIILFHQVLTRVLPSPEQVPTAGTLGCGSNSSCNSSARPSISGWAAAPGASSAVFGKPCNSRLQLNATYISKLAMAKACDAVFMALNAWQHSTVAHTIGLVLPVMGSSFVIPAAAAAAAGYAASGLSILTAAAMITFRRSPWLQRHISAVNTGTWATSLLARLAMLAAQPEQLTGSVNMGSGSQNAVDRALPVPPAFAFHTFSMLACTLATHEEPLPWFTAQLVGLGLLWRQIHLLLLQHTPGASLQQQLLNTLTLDSLWQLPEYVLLTAGILLAYPWTCVGKQAGREPAEVAQHLRHSRPQSLDHGASHQKPMSMAAALSHQGSKHRRPSAMQHASFAEEPLELTSPRLHSPTGTPRGAAPWGPRQQQQKSFATAPGALGIVHKAAMSSETTSQQLAGSLHGSRPSVSQGTAATAADRSTFRRWQQWLPKWQTNQQVVSQPMEETCSIAPPAEVLEEEEDGLLLQQQRYACDVAMGVLLLVRYMQVAAALLKKTAATAHRWVGGGGVAILAGHLWLLQSTLRDQRAWCSKRDQLWLASTALAPCLLLVAEGLGLTGAGNPARHHLLSLAACLGVLDVSIVKVVSLLPLMVIVSLIRHTWAATGTASRGMLVAEAAELNLLTLLLYMTARAISIRLQQKLSGAMLVCLSALGGRRVQLQHRKCKVTAAVLGQILVALGVLYAVALLWAHLPADKNALQWANAIQQGIVNMLERLSLDLHTQKDTIQTAVTILGIGISFCVLSLVQAYVLSNPALRDTRLVWYEQQKARVVGLAEATMARLGASKDKAGSQELMRALTTSGSELAAGCFPGCTTLLVLLEEASLDSGLAQRYVLQAAPEAALLPQQEQMELAELPAVELTCRRRQTLAIDNSKQSILGYADLEALADEFGMDSFLVVPLSCAGQDQGALLVTSRAPVSLDRYMRRLADDLGHHLSQTLYTLSCIGQLRAGEQIIHDIMPEAVAQQLKRRFHRECMADSAATRGHGKLLSQLSFTASALRAQQQKLQAVGQQQGQQPAEGDRSSLRSCLGIAEVPVVYKQWHPAVSVLFADISSYTAMSQQVEPEQVMSLLHELFSKYDKLCTHYGIYKVETIGDCYMACSGLLVDNPDHARHLVEFGQAMLMAAASVPHPLGGSVHIRVGIHSGRVMSGIVGSIRARYCLFGDTVNTASRMESTGVVDRIQVSEDTFQLLGDLQSDFELREALAVKGKGIMNTYILQPNVSSRLQEEGSQQLQAKCGVF